MRPNQIATCFHVIAGITSGTIKLVGTERESKIDAKKIIGDEKHDLALLKVADFGVPPLLLDNSVQVGETVHVLGNPQDSEGNISEGNISTGIIGSIQGGSDAEYLEYLGGNPDFSPNEFFQMSAQIDRGSSGGPVLNGEGKVIAISFMTFEDREVSSSKIFPKISSDYLKVFNFAIPSKYLQALLDQQGTEEPLDRERSISAYTYYLWGTYEVETKTI